MYIQKGKKVYIKYLSNFGLSLSMTNLQHQTWKPASLM